jgi:hypothetical protein
LPDRWQSLSVSQLQERAESSVRSSWRSLEPATLLRAMAMIVIVARHTHSFVYSKNYGAGFLMFALGGYALARFQLPEIIRKGSARSALGTALLVAIPTILVVGPSQLMTRTFEPLQYFLASNFLDPTDPRWVNGVSFYFAEIYIQLFLVAALLFSFSQVRALFRDHPMASALGLFAAAVGVDHVAGIVWDTDYLYGRVPQSYGWVFAIGILVGVARTLPQRLLAMAVVAISGFILWGLEWSGYFVVGGLALVLFVPMVRVPALVKSVIGEIAAASMFIYLSHGQLTSVVTRLFGERKPWISLVVAVMGGIAFAYLYGYAQRLLGQTKAGRRFFNWLAG